MPSIFFCLAIYLWFLASLGSPLTSPVLTPMLTTLAVLCSVVACAQASVTVYGQIAFGLTASATGSTPAPTTTPAAYNNTRLVPPAIPNPPPANNFTLTLQQSAAGVNNLSIPHVGAGFWGFSIEMSVIGQVREWRFFLPEFFLLS